MCERWWCHNQSIINQSSRKREQPNADDADCWTSTKVRVCCVLHSSHVLWDLWDLSMQDALSDSNFQPSVGGSIKTSNGFFGFFFYGFSVKIYASFATNRPSIISEKADPWQHDRTRHTTTSCYDVYTSVKLLYPCTVDRTSYSSCSVWWWCTWMMHMIRLLLGR